MKLKSIPFPAYMALFFIFYFCGHILLAIWTTPVKEVEEVKAWHCSSLHDDVEAACIRSMVDTFYEGYKANKDFIKLQCQFMAVEITCEEIE